MFQKKNYSEWESVTDGVTQGSLLVPPPPFFLLYINPFNAELNPICHLLALVAHQILHVSRIMVNDIPNAISDISNPMLYADDTSLIITNSDSQMFEKDINTATLQLDRWFNSNLLLLNLEKTYFLQVLTKNN